MRVNCQVSSRVITVKAGALLKCPTCLCALRQLPLSSCPRGTTGNPTRRNRCHICRQHNHGLHQCLLRPVLMSSLCEHFRKITTPLSFSFSMTHANESCHSYKRTMSYIRMSHIHDEIRHTLCTYLELAFRAWQTWPSIRTSSPC